jgi:hypothetical protein
MGLPWLALRRMNGFSPVNITRLGSAMLMAISSGSASSLSRVARSAAGGGQMMRN